MGVEKVISIYSVSDEQLFLVSDPFDKDFNRILTDIDTSLLKIRLHGIDIFDISFLFNVNSGELIMNFRFKPSPNIEKKYPSTHWAKCPRTYFTAFFKTDADFLLDFDNEQTSTVTFEYLRCRSAMEEDICKDDHYFDDIVGKEFERNKLNLISFLKREFRNFATPDEL